MKEEEFRQKMLSRKAERKRQATAKIQATKLLKKQCKFKYRRIIQYTKSGEVLDIFDDVWDASEKLNIDVDYIIRVVTYRQASTMGYVFRFQDKYDDMRYKDEFEERLRKKRDNSTF